MTIDLEERLRRDLRSGRADDMDAAGLVRDARRRAAARSHRVRAVAAGTAAVLVAGGVVGIALRPGEAERTASEPGVTAASAGAAPSPTVTVAPTTAADTISVGTAPPAPGPLAAQAWQTIAENPLGVRYNAVAVWTGSEAITWGGSDGVDTAYVDGAAYDPVANEWRTISPSPLSPRIDERAFWTGSHMLVLGGSTPSGEQLLPQLAAYDPSTDSWSWRATPPFLSVTTDDVAVWTGDGLVVWTRDGEAARYDDATDTWTALPAAPIAARAKAAAVWTGTEVIVWGGEDGAGGNGAGDNLADGAALDPTTGTWRTLAASPLSGRVTTAVWTGDAMVVRGGYQGTGTVMALGDGARYDPLTDSWTEIAKGPAHPGFTAVWTGSVVVEMAKGGAVLWNPSTDRWADPSELSEGSVSQQPPLWTGTYVLVFGPLTDGSAAGGTALRPDLVTG